MENENAIYFLFYIGYGKEWKSQTFTQASRKHSSSSSSREKLLDSADSKTFFLEAARCCCTKSIRGHSIFYRFSFALSLAHTETVRSQTFLDSNLAGENGDENFSMSNEWECVCCALKLNHRIKEILLMNQSQPSHISLSHFVQSLLYLFSTESTIIPSNNAIVWLLAAACKQPTIHFQSNKTQWQKSARSICCVTVDGWRALISLYSTHCFRLFSQDCSHSDEPAKRESMKCRRRRIYVRNMHEFWINFHHHATAVSGTLSPSPLVMHYEPRVEEFCVVCWAKREGCRSRKNDKMFFWLSFSHIFNSTRRLLSLSHCCSPFGDPDNNVVIVWK